MGLSGMRAGNEGRVKVTFNWHWICRPLGGLFLGIRADFPVHVIDDTDVATGTSLNTPRAKARGFLLHRGLRSRA